tara:strand:- start:881 stop:1045 length:165 start_codon:yes stop_codon:yes gene_type:complete
MKPILDIFKRKEEKEKPYMVMGDNKLPLWVIPLPSGVNMDTEEDVNSELIKERE